MKNIFRSTVFFLIVASTCLGRDIYVSKKYGDDRNMGFSKRDNSSMEGPVASIGRALELARSGDRIIVDPKDGPYRESITLFGRNQGGTLERPLVIEGCGAVLDGTELIPKGTWQHYQDDIFRFQLTISSVNRTYFQLFNNGKLLKRIDIISDPKKISDLEPETWCLSDGFVYLRCQENASVFDPEYQISYSDRLSGISIIQDSNVRIHDLTLQGFQLDGISAINAAENIVLDNVVCRDNGRSGLAVGSASSVAAGYCDFENNPGIQILALPYSKTILYSCSVDENEINKSEQNAEVLIREDENKSP